MWAPWRLYADDGEEKDYRRRQEAKLFTHFLQEEPDGKKRTE